MVAPRCITSASADPNVLFLWLHFSQPVKGISSSKVLICSGTITKLSRNCTSATKQTNPCPTHHTTAGWTGDEKSARTALLLSLTLSSSSDINCLAEPGWAWGWGGVGYRIDRLPWRVLWRVDSVECTTVQPQAQGTCGASRPVRSAITGQTTKPKARARAKAKAKPKGKGQSQARPNPRPSYAHGHGHR